MNDCIRLYHTKHGQTDILFTADFSDDHYFRVNFLYPFSGISSDYFEDNAEYTSGIPDAELNRFVSELVNAIKKVSDGFSSRYENYGSLPKSKEEITKLLEETVRLNTFRPQKTKWSKLLTETLAEKLVASQDCNYNVCTDDIHFPVIHHDNFRKYGEVQPLRKDLLNVPSHWWLWRFLADEEFGCSHFKTIALVADRLRISTKLMKRVRKSDFAIPTENELPLFIGSQFGIIPRLEVCFLEELEGQNIAIIGKSMLSGVVSGLTISKIQDGQLIQIKKFNNERLTEQEQGTLFSKPKPVEKFDPKTIVYRIHHEGRNVYARRKFNLPQTGFVLILLHPYKDVKWEHENGEVLSEPDQQKILPKVIGDLKALYQMAECNYEFWSRNYSSFRINHPDMEEELRFDWYVEYLCGSIEKGIYFPEGSERSHSRFFFRAVIRQILKTGRFPHLSDYSTEEDFEKSILEQGHTIIDVTPYEDDTKSRIFDKMGRIEKENLFIAMINGYGSQFDRMVAKWKGVHLGEIM